VTLPSLEELEAASSLVYRSMLPSPQLCWPLLSERCGCDVLVKHENHIPTGAFKVRGGLVYIDRLLQRQPDLPGLVSATRGNHGQSVAVRCLVTDPPSDLCSQSRSADQKCPSSRQSSNHRDDIHRDRMEPERQPDGDGQRS